MSEDKTYEKWLVDRYVQRRWADDSVKVHLPQIQPTNQRIYYVDTDDGQFMLEVLDGQVVDLDEEAWYENLAAKSRVLGICGNEPTPCAEWRKPHYGYVMVVELKSRQLYQVPQADWHAAEETDAQEPLPN